MKKDNRLEKLRAQIDTIDDQILAELNHRADIVKRIGRVKACLLYTSFVFGAIGTAA